MLILTENGNVLVLSAIPLTEVLEICVMNHRWLKLLINQIFYVPHDRISVFLMSSFKIQELSQDNQFQTVLVKVIVKHTRSRIC